MDDETTPGTSRNPGVEDLRASERAGIRGDGGFENPNQVENLTDDIEKPSRSEKLAERNESGASSLNDAEKSASNGSGLYKGRGLSGVKEGEEAPRGFYTNNSKQKITGKSKGGKKKVGPFVAIILSIFGFGGVMFGAQMFQPFSLVANFMQAFNSMHISANARSSYWVRWQLGGVDAGVKNPVKGSIFGEAKFKITDSQKVNLAKQGIEYDDSARILKYKGEDISADEFKAKYDSDSEFHEAYNAGSQTWRGQFANWFGSATIDFFTNNRLTRNMFKDFRQKVDESGDSSMAVLKSILKQRIDGGGGDGGVRAVGKKEAEEDSEGTHATRTDANGNVTDTDDNGNRVKGELLDSGDTTSINRTNIANKISDISSKFGSAANIYCALSSFAGTVSALVAAAQALEIINLTTGIFESVDKAKVGYGDDSPINDFATALNTKTENVNIVLTDDAGAKFGSAVDSGAEQVDGATEEVKTEKTAMESEGVNSLYGDGIVNPNDPSVKSFNLTSYLPKIFGGIGMSMASFTSCAVAKMATNAISAVASAAEIGGCIAGLLGAAFTFGTTAAAGCAPLITSLAFGFAKTVAIGLAVAALASIMTPIATNALTKDLMGKLSGEDFGNAITSGANMYQGSVHRGNGGSLATEAKYTAYAAEQRRIIADDARNERESLSPFDPTSDNTFMGALLRNVATMTSGTGSIMGTVTSTSSMLSNSITAMAPAAVADGISVKKTLISDYEDVCPYLASIGAVGDAYCNPYMITDTNTIPLTPGEVIDKVIEIDANNFEDEETSEGNVKIKDGSPLAKYIVYCDQRQSQFGITDYNIANNVGNFGNTGSTTGNVIVGAIPIIGDALDVINSKVQLDNSGYISGESCVAGNNIGTFVSPNWNTGQYYQRLIEDQSLAESTGLITESAVTAYLREYYEENPLDNSYEGMLARYSGLTTEQVADVIDMLWYAEYIQNYDPTERYAFDGAELVDKEMAPVEFDNENVLASDDMPRTSIVYADVRNRSFAA
ncbi:hypothetical protein IKE87_01070 [Candidatus Saccharibacteria bacterium]|nr:hypothetical protein [Candidatus Saccharibacteria bacterium]